MKAKVTVAFDGVEDGYIIPRRFEIGEEITGDIAKVAVTEKWAKKVKEREPKAAEDPVDSTRDSFGATDGEGAAGGSGDGSGATDGKGAAGETDGSGSGEGAASGASSE